MADIRRLHREAMEMADSAFIARRSGSSDEALGLFDLAFRLEFEAAHQTTKEPSRSVLYRSAATLALHGQLYREAEIAVAFGLTGDPPTEIADELREVFERINFHRHLSIQGVELNPNELQMTIVGNVVSEGMALTDAVFMRVQSFEKMVIRTAQRINNKPFSRMTPSNFYNFYMSTPRTGSFAVTLRVGQPNQQMLPDFDDRERIIDEVIFNLDLLNQNRIEDLKNAIPDKDYYQSFLGVAKAIAPDGNDVKLVGVTTLRNGIESSVGFSVTRKEIKPSITETPEFEGSTLLEAPQTMQITGELLFANAIKQSKIKIVDDTGKEHSIYVSEAIAEDVVKPYFGSRVTIDAVRGKRNQLYFEDINPSSS